MDASGLTFEALVMQPQPGRADDQSPDFVLPEMLAGYTRTERTLIVQAVRDSDTMIVAMGAGWILGHPDRGEALLVKAAEVDDPYPPAEMRSELMACIRQSAHAMGIREIHVSPELAERYVDLATPTPWQVRVSRWVPAALMRQPHCPACGRRISFAHSLEIWNPWRVTCPHCAAPLEASARAKAAWAMSVPLGVLVAIVPISMERAGRWTQADSLFYFASLLLILLPISYIAWTRVTLSIRPSTGQ